MNNPALPEGSWAWRAPEDAFRPGARRAPAADGGVVRAVDSASARSVDRSALRGRPQDGWTTAHARNGGSIDVLVRLSALIDQHREALLTRWRGQVRQLASAQHLDVPTLNDHIPELLSELAAALRTHSDETISEAHREASPPAHGLQRVQDGFDIEEVVAEYNILRGCIHDLADENGLTLQGRPFHIVNRVLDQAIGLAVQTYATQRALEVQERREEYLSFVAHDLRTPLNAISLTSRVLESALRDRTDGPDTSRPLKALHRNVQHLEELVRKILDENVHPETETARARSSGGRSTCGPSPSPWFVDLNAGGGDRQDAPGQRGPRRTAPSTRTRASCGGSFRT